MQEVFIVSSIALLAAISPGPDFILVLKNNLIYGLKKGVVTSLGIGAGVLIHITYCIAGIGFIISQSILLFNIIKILGALYLLYLAFLLFKSKKQTVEIKEAAAVEKKNYKFFVEGFLANVLNPKATIFFLSVFTQVLNPEFSVGYQFFLGLCMLVVVTVWFIIFSLLLNSSFIKNKITGFQFWVEKVMGGFLAFLGVKILLDANK